MMSSKRVAKSPTLVGVFPTFVLVPLVLMRTWSRSGNCPVVVRVQKLNCAPSSKVTGGVNNQLLRVAKPAPLWKFTAM